IDTCDLPGIIAAFDEHRPRRKARPVRGGAAVRLPDGHRTRRHSDDHDPWAVTPTARAARADDDLLDADDGRIFRLTLDPVGVHLDAVIEVSGGENRRRESRRRRCESNSCEHSDHHNSDGRGTPSLPRTGYAYDVLLLSKRIDADSPNARWATLQRSVKP